MPLPPTPVIEPVHDSHGVRGDVLGRHLRLLHHLSARRARHLDLVCRELENIMSGQTKRLMIFMPPRHGKSMTVTETFPSFFLGKNPEISTTCLPVALSVEMTCFTSFAS